MKLKPFLLIALSFLFTACVYGQKSKINISEKLKKIDLDEFKGHLKSDESGHYIYYYEKKGKLVKLILNKYDKNLKEIFSKEYTSNVDDAITYGVYPLKNNFVWITGYYDKKDDKATYNAVPISFDGAPSEKIRLASFNVEKKRELPRFITAFSPDSTKFAFGLFTDNNDNDKKIQLYTAVFNPAMEKELEKNYQLPNTEELLDVLGLAVNNAGKVFYLNKDYEGESGDVKKETKRVKGKKAAAYDLKLMSITKADDLPKNIKLDIKGAFLRHGDIAVNPKNDLVVAGFYANTKRGPAQGVFFVKMDADGATIASAKREFSDADLKTLGNKNVSKNFGDKGLDYSFEFKPMIFKADGSLNLIAEKNYVVVYRDPKTGATRSVYHSDDIILTNISSDGKINRINVVPKKQTLGQLAHHSHVAMFLRDDVKLIMNETKKNLKLAAGKKPKRIVKSSNTIAALVTVKPNGAIDRKELFGRDDVKALLVPTLSKRINDNTIFMVIGKHEGFFSSGEFRIAILTLE